MLISFVGVIDAISISRAILKIACFSTPSWPQPWTSFSKAGVWLKGHQAIIYLVIGAREWPSPFLVNSD